MPVVTPERTKAREVLPLLQKDLTPDQWGRATVEMMALYITAFMEEHDRHLTPQTVKNISEALEKRVNEILDERYKKK